MLILHAALLENDLHLWAETSESIGNTAKTGRTAPHPFASKAQDLKQQLEAAGIWEKKTKAPAENVTAWLPSTAESPLPSSPLLSIEQKTARPKFTAWQVEALRLPLPAALTLLGKALQGNPLHPGIIAGEDVLFWARMMRFAGSLIARQSYVPDLVQGPANYHARWRPVLTSQEIIEFAALTAAMPGSARALTIAATVPVQQTQDVLDRFLATVVDALVRETELVPQGLVQAKGKKPVVPVPNSVHDAWVQALLAEKDKVTFAAADLAALEPEIRRWQKPLEMETATPWRLCFRLEEPLLQREDLEAEDDGSDEDWEVRYLLQPRDEPSLLIPLEQAWQPHTAGHNLLLRAGNQAPEYLLTALGQASALYPEIAASLRGKVSGGFTLQTPAAFKFLTEYAPTLENAGFGVFLPSWWSRHGARGRLTAQANVRSPKFQSQSGLTMQQLVKFDWKIALGGQELSVEELEQLALMKYPLVRFRGQWVQVNHDQIQKALKFWKQKGEQAATARDLLRLALGSPGAETAVAEDSPVDLEVTGVTADGWFADMMQRLTGGAKLETLPAPAGFGGKLRPYQESGYSWMEFLGQWGLGACLADDMGLGKTVQVLALLQRHWEHGQKNGGTKPVLLICPTSVVMNWQKEAERFTPELPVHIHHGATRRKQTLASEAKEKALVISSYALLHRDLEQFKAVEWNGVVLDEAQYIKNSQTRQAQAARALQSDFRIAMTGTPVENNVGDLWNLMEFLNPGLLGTQSEFRKRFFLPIQSNSSPEATERLKQLAGPFILRRLKTDKNVISDLPDKVETKAYCNLTKEQASLYSAVVDEAMALIENKEGIDRRGAVLTMLAKLKQVCNHPAQFLKDGTAIGDRSGKVNRLRELIEEMLLEGDCGLIFTQFHEMGDMLQRHLQDNFGREVLFLHGGTTKKARDEMVARFQDYENPRAPKLFILSLKAGGVGLNLTRANHVFHFDRWWNPAVENQATDRAFRIGQQKNVQVHKFLCAGTLEEKVDEMIEAKQSLATNVLGTGENWLTELSNTELRDLLQLQKNAVIE